MARTKYYITYDFSMDGELETIIKKGLVSHVKHKGYIVIGRFGTNKTELRSIAKKLVGTDEYPVV